MSQQDQTWNKLGQQLGSYSPDGPREEHFQLIQKQLNDDGFSGKSTSAANAGWLYKWILGGLGLMVVVAVSWAIVSNANTTDLLSERIGSDDFNIEDASISPTDVVSNELGVASQESNINRLEATRQNKDGGLNNQHTSLGAADQRSKGFPADHLTDSSPSSEGEQAASSDSDIDPSPEQDDLGSSLPSVLSSGDSDDGPASSGVSEGGLVDGEGQDQSTVGSTYGVAVLDNRFPPAEACLPRARRQVQSQKTDSLEITPFVNTDEIRPTRQRRWSVSLGHMWHLRSNPTGENEIDPGLYYRLSYDLPISEKMDIRFHIGYRDQAAIRLGKPWLVYEEEVTIIPTTGSNTPVTFRYFDQYDDHRAVSMGGELQANFSRFQTRIGLLYAYNVAKRSRRSGSMTTNVATNPFADYRANLLTSHDFALTGGLAYRLFPRWSIYANAQYGLVDLSPNGFWERPKRETSHGVELGISYSF